MNTDAEQISKDHVYATGRDLIRILDIIDSLKERIEKLESPEKPYRDQAKELGINVVGKKKEVILQEIAERINGTDEQETEQGSGLPEDV